MKKILAFLLILIMVFSLAACGNKDDKPSGDGEKNPDNSQNGGENNNGGGNTDALLAGIGSSTVIYSQMDEASKQQLVMEGKAEGIDISFGTDGSTTFVDNEDGTVVVQKPDGSWVVKDADGGEGQIGGNWPDNEYTRLVPKPSLELQATYIEGESFGATFTNATVEQIRDYVEQVKAAGFNINEVVEDREFGEMVLYSFTAENADGYIASITFANGTSSLSIGK